MATTDEEHFLRSSLLLHKGTFYIGKKVLMREEEREIQKTRHDLDYLLVKNRRDIEHEFRHYKQREILFPPNGKTDIQKWDVSLLTGVLLNVFKASLSAEERKAMKHIKHQRNEIFSHSSTVSLSLDDYTDTCDELKAAYDTLASGFSSEVQNECNKIVDSCLRGALDLKSHIEQLKLMFENGEMFLKVIAKIDKTGAEITNNVTKTLEQEMSVVRRDMSTIRDKQRNQEDMTKKVLQKLEEMQGKQCKRKVKVVDSLLEFSGNDEDQHNIDLADSIITTVTNEAIRRAGTAEEYTEIREIIQEILDEIRSQSDVKALGAVKGCVIISFDCDTYEQLFNLITYMESNDMKKRLNELAASLSRLLNTKGKLYVSLNLSLKTLQSVLDEIETTLEREYKRYVRIPIQFESVTGVNRVLDLFHRGGLRKCLNKLSGALSDKVGAKINVRSSINMEQLQEALEDLGSNLIPEEILQMDRDSIELYKQALAESKGVDHRIRVFILGNYGVGKTTLAKRLLGKDVDIGKVESTDGKSVPDKRCNESLNTCRWNFVDKGTETAKADIGADDCTAAETYNIKGKHREEKHGEQKDEQSVNYSKKLMKKLDVDDVLVQVWDFGGQYAFYSTSQIFSPRRVIYLIVTDIFKNLEYVVENKCYVDRKGADRLKISEYIQFWLNSIHEFCNSSEKGPPVILVGTFADKLDAKTKEDTVKAVFKNLRHELVNMEIVSHLTGGDFAVDNTVVDSNIEKLKEHIFKTASEQTYWGETIPARWISLERVIRKDNDCKVLRKAELRDLNSTLPNPIQTEEELELFLRFHHESGNIVYFRDDQQHYSIILDPKWLIDAFISLITERVAQDIQFAEPAVLTNEFVDAVWGRTENVQFYREKMLLLNFFDQQCIIAKPIQHMDTHEAVDFYIAPCLLSMPPPDFGLEWNKHEKHKSTSKLCFKTSSGFLPAELFNKLLASCLRQWPLCRWNGKPTIFSCCGIFDLKDNHTLFIYFYDSVIQVWLTKVSTSGKEPDRNLCLEAKTFVLDLLQNKFRMKSSIDVFVKCQDADLRSTKDEFSVNAIAQEHEVACCCRGLPHLLRTQDILKYWQD